MLSNNTYNEWNRVFYIYVHIVYSQLFPKIQYSHRTRYTRRKRERRKRNYIRKRNANEGTHNIYYYFFFFYELHTSSADLSCHIHTQGKPIIIVFRVGRPHDDNPLSFFSRRKHSRGSAYCYFGHAYRVKHYNSKHVTERDARITLLYSDEMRMCVIFSFRKFSHRRRHENTIFFSPYRSESQRSLLDV